ncbi:MAG: NHL repeat-containing protein [Planctomycetes bacterium]|nr:NHL repeat-containing protein [Planctomycetota bacterium]
MFAKAESVLLWFLFLVPAGRGQEFAGNDLFVSAGAGDTILHLGGDGTVKEVIFTTGDLQDPAELSFGAHGHMYVASRGTDRVLEISADGFLVREIGEGSGLDEPFGLAVGANARLYVSAPAQDLVYAFDPSGAFAGTLDGGGVLDEPRGLLAGPGGGLFVCSHATDRLLELGPGGDLLREIGAGSSLDGPDRVCLGENDHLYVTSSETGLVIEFDGSGSEVAVIGAATGMSEASGIAFGPDGLLYVADGGSDRIHRFAADGAPAGDLFLPTSALVALAFAPLRFQANLSGTAQLRGGAAIEIDEQAVLALRAGSKTLFLALSDDADDPLDLASLTGRTEFVFHGWEGYGTAAQERLLHGAQVAAASAGSGVLSLAVDAEGDLDQHGRYRVKDFSGSVHLDGGCVFKGRVRARKLLE